MSFCHRTNAKDNNDNCKQNHNCPRVLSKNVLNSTQFYFLIRIYRFGYSLENEILPISHHDTSSEVLILIILPPNLIFVNVLFSWSTLFFYKYDYFTRY